MTVDLANVELVAHAGSIELSVKVVPGASRTQVVGAWGKALKVAVAAPPQGGKANEAVVKLLASVFGVRKATVGIVSGHGKPLKRISISGLTVAQAHARLA